MTGSQVTQLIDKSGNGNSTSAYGGTITYTTTLNGNRGITFVGNSSYFSCPLVVQNDWSIFIVLTTTSTGGAGPQWYQGYGLYDTETAGVTTDYGLAIINGKFALGVGQLTGTTDYTAVTTTSVNTGAGFICETTRVSSTGQINMYLTGNSQVSATGPTGTRTSASNPVTIGATSHAISQAFVGTIYEIIVYNTALGTSDLQSVEGYLAQKWGLTASLPAGHIGLSKTFYRSTFVPVLSIPYFIPTQIASCQLWLDAADPNFLTAPNGTLTAWKDKSGKNNHAVLTGTITYSSNTVSTDGSSYFYAPVDSRRTTVPNLQVFIVYAWTGYASGGNRGLWGDDDGGWNRLQLLSFPANAGEAFGLSQGSTAPLVNVISGLNTASRLIYHASYNGLGTTASYAYINGNQSINFTDTAASPQTSLTNTWFGAIGPNSDLPAQIAINEIIIYNKVLTTYERNQIEAYLAQKWTLTSYLPPGHIGLSQTFSKGSYSPLYTIVYPSIILNGLVYHLDAGNTSSYSGSGSTWNDLTGSGISMTLYGSPTYSSANGGYLSFAPASAQYGETSTKLAGMPVWTAEVWHYYNGTNSTGYPCILTDVFPQTGNINITLGHASSGGSNTNLQAAYFILPTWYCTSTTYSLPASGWYHIVGTYDGTNISLYINGALSQQTASSATPTQASGTGFRIMRRWDNPDYWGGYLAVLRIYNRALSITEIGRNYSAQKSRFGL
jgi:hypothetical protein